MPVLNVYRKSEESRGYSLSRLYLLHSKKQGDHVISTCKSKNQTIISKTGIMICNFKRAFIACNNFENNKCDFWLVAEVA